MCDVTKTLHFTLSQNFFTGELFNSLEYLCFEKKLKMLTLWFCLSVCTGVDPEICVRGGGPSLSFLSPSVPPLPLRPWHTGKFSFETFERKFRVCHENFRKFSPFESSFQWLAQVLFWKVFFRKPSAVIGWESVCCKQRHRVDGR